MTWSDDEWPRWWLIDDWWKGPVLDKLVCSRQIDEIYYHITYITSRNDMRLTLDNNLHHHIYRIYRLIWPRVHEQKSRSSLINRSMGWDKIDILPWSYHWQTWLKSYDCWRLTTWPSLDFYLDKIRGQRTNKSFKKWKLYWRRALKTCRRVIPKCR